MLALLSVNVEKTQRKFLKQKLNDDIAIKLKVSTTFDRSEWQKRMSQGITDADLVNKTSKEKHYPVAITWFFNNYFFFTDVL